ncbi:hypothetical protein [Haladaptatus sp. DJG-WS-42]|uniref:hypothetical protein n=1 Tax=Haladaptatus sp. DJG-WS-42 TaxID=3120516 RepID=UPI0030CDEE7F
MSPAGTDTDSCHFPQIPYDEVRSARIREAIRRGDFEDIAHRRFVNDLVYVEWYTRIGIAPTLRATTANGIRANVWRLAMKYPTVFDTIRRELGATTREEAFNQEDFSRWDWNGEEDPLSRRIWATRHGWEWNRVCDENAKIRQGTADRVQLSVRPAFAPFRFPELHYDDLRSDFIIEEIRRGSFDDLEYRQYVNKLVYIETWTREPTRIAFHAVPHYKPWLVCAQFPEEYDIIRRELGAPTRADFERNPPPIPAAEVESRARQHKREWLAVQEHQSPPESSLFGTRR